MKVKSKINNKSLNQSNNKKIVQEKDLIFTHLKLNSSSTKATNENNIIIDNYINNNSNSNNNNSTTIEKLQTIFKKKVENNTIKKKINKENNNNNKNLIQSKFNLYTQNIRKSINKNSIRKNTKIKDPSSNSDISNSNENISQKTFLLYEPKNRRVHSINEDSLFKAAYSLNNNINESIKYSNFTSERNLRYFPKIKNTKFQSSFNISLSGRDNAKNYFTYNNNKSRNQKQPVKILSFDNDSLSDPMNSYTINSTFRTFNKVHKINMPKIKHQTYNFSNNSLSENKKQSKPHVHFKHKSGMLNNIIQKLKKKKLFSPKFQNSNLRLKKKQKKNEKKVHYLTDNESKKNKNENDNNKNNNTNNNKNNNEIKKNSKALSSKKLEIKFNKQSSNQFIQLSKISESSSINNLTVTNLDNSFCKSVVDRKEIISKFLLKEKTNNNNLNGSFNGTDYENSSSDISFLSMEKINYKDKKMKNFFSQKKTKKKKKIVTKRENFNFENDIYDKINSINKKRNSIKNIYYNKIKNIIAYYKINKENNIMNVFEKQIFEKDKKMKLSDFKETENISEYTKIFKKSHFHLNSYFKTLNKYYIENCLLEKYFNIQISKIIYLFNFITSNDLEKSNLLKNFSIKPPRFKGSHNCVINNILGLNINLKIFPGFDLIFLSTFHRRDFEYDIDISKNVKQEEKISLSKIRASVIFSCLKSSKSGIKFTNRGTWKYLIKKNTKLKKEEREEKLNILKKALKRNKFYSRNAKSNLRAESTTFLNILQTLSKTNNNSNLSKTINMNNKLRERKSLKIDGYVNKIQMISRVTDLKYKIVQSLTKKLDTLFFYIKDRNFPSFKNTFDKYKIDPDSKDQYGDSLLILAVKSNCFQIANYLINAGASVNLTNKNSNSPLHFALTFRNFEIADMLIKSGADENIQNKFGITPWMCLDNRLSIM